MNILITGGAGYLGTELVYKLARDPRVNSITVYDNLSRKNYNLFIHHALPQGKVRFIKGDILDSRKIRKTLREVDVVYHMAAIVTTPFASQDPHFFEQVNHWGTAELVYAIEGCANIRQLVYTSSTSVYGASDDEVDEKTIPNPKTYYGISKLRGEEHVNRLKKKMNTQIMRLGNIYGYSPSMRFDAVINRFLLEANFNNRISIHGNGKQTRAFLHVQKAVEGFARILQADVPSGTYNLIDKNLSVQEIAEKLRAHYPTLEMIYINQHMDLRELRVRKHTAIQPYISLDETSLTDELAQIKDHFSFQPQQAKINTG